jgi:hypothetical protein
LIVALREEHLIGNGSGGGLVHARLLDWWHSGRDETNGVRAMAGMTKRPFLTIRMIVDVLIALLFVLVGLGEFTAGIHGWPSLNNLGSVALCLLIAAGFFLDFARTKKRFDE